jgi:hypothetical protein
MTGSRSRALVARSAAHLRVIPSAARDLYLNYERFLVASLLGMTRGTVFQC